MMRLFILSTLALSAAALLACNSNETLLSQAPVKQPVRRLDEVGAARKPVLTWTPANATV